MSYIREEHGVKYFGYDIDEYPFVDLVSKAFKVDNLQNLHDLLSDTEQDRINKRLVPNEKDAHSDLHQIFYEKLNQGWPELMDTYESFIEGIIAPIFKTENIIFQSKPTFRIQFPNNIAVGGNAGDKKGQYGWHRDTDPGYDHPNNEKNFIIPLTRARDTASVFIESAPRSDKFYPATMNVGEVFNFSGGECVHGNKPNGTGKCRVSFDFRVVLPEDYNEAYGKSSALSTKKFTVGSYYKQLKK